MKAILEFNLPEEDTEFVWATRGSNYYFALNDIKQEIFTHMDRAENDTEYEKWQKINELFYEILEHRRVNLAEVE